MIWFVLATVLLLLADLFLIWALSVEDNHWLVKRRGLLGRDRPRKRDMPQDPADSRPSS